MIALTLGACKTTNRQEKEEFIVDLRSPSIPIGEVEFQYDSPLGIGNLHKRIAEVLYFPREDAVALQYRLDFTTYHQFWSRDGRQLFIQALAKYNEDYDARDLNRTGGRRTLLQYGTTEGYLIWQVSALTIQARANMDLELGYSFKDRFPYFTINQKAAEYIDPDARSNNRTSMVTTMYITRAQGAQIAELFDQYFLRESVGELRNMSIEDTYADVDEY